MLTKDQENLEEFFTDEFTKDEYVKQFDSLEKNKKRSIIYDLTSIPYADIYNLIIRYPKQAFKIINGIAYSAAKLSPTYTILFPKPEIDVRLIGVQETISLRKINSDCIGKIVRIKGMVNKVSMLKPMYVEAVFKCRTCGTVLPSEPQDHPTILIQPTKCECKGTAFDVVPELSLLADSQEIRIQELPDDTPSGQTPRNYNVSIFSHDLIDTVQCGDIVDIIGVVKIVEEKSFNTKTKFNHIYLVVNNVVVNSKEPETTEISEDDEKEIISLSKNPQIVDLMIESIAPSIYGNNEIKEAIVYQLIGGVCKKYANATVKGEINTLLVGDPSGAKSQMLMLTSRLAPRGIYVSGRGVSAAGLTCACVKDKNNEFAVEAGAMVLADLSLCCIDEIDKIKPDDRAALHEAMSLQQVSKDMAGIHVTLKTRTAVLAAGNPTLTRYDTSKTVNDNISNLSSSLINRFDLIFIVIDKPEEVRDRNISGHILGAQDEKLQPISTETIKKYIIYAKRIKPKLTKDAIDYLTNFYVKLRQETNSSTSIAIAPRQLEGLRRLSEAHARLLLKIEAGIEDAKAAVKIMEFSLNQVSVDPETGTRNIDRIDAKTKTDDKIDVIRKLLPRKRDELMSKLISMGMSKEDIEKILHKLTEGGIIYSPDGGSYLCIVPQRTL